MASHVPRSEPGDAEGRRRAHRGGQRAGARRARRVRAVAGTRPDADRAQGRRADDRHQGSARATRCRRATCASIRRARSRSSSSRRCRRRTSMREAARNGAQDGRGRAREVGRQGARRRATQNLWRAPVGRKRASTPRRHSVVLARLGASSGPGYLERYAEDVDGARRRRTALRGVLRGRT